MSTSRPVTPTNTETLDIATLPASNVRLELSEDDRTDLINDDHAPATTHARVETNIFIQLENYLASDRAKQDAEKYTRKLNDFVDVIRVKLPNQPVIQKADETDEFAPNGVLDTTSATAEANQAYLKQINETTKNYNKGFFGLFTGHSGEFQSLMKELHNTKPGDVQSEHRAYMARLEGETSAIAEQIKKSLKEPTKIELQQSWVETIRSRASKK